MASTRSVFLIFLLLASGCIVGDQITTLTIHPDGSADLVVFRSNLHSTEKGDKGKKELADYKANFRSVVDDEFARIRADGEKAAEVHWVREEAPFSNIVRMHLASASTLEKYGTLQTGDEGLQTTAKFHSEGSHRKLSIHLSVSPATKDTLESAEQNVQELRQSQANGISETRIAVTRGSITASRGFTVANDAQSAVLNVAEIIKAVRSTGETEFFLEWDITP